MRAAGLALALALLSIACERDAAPLDFGGARAEVPSALDPRTPLDLARALDRVERADPYDADDGYRQVIDDFEGRRFRWRLQLLAPLCTPERCNVLALGAGDRAKVGQSWMPRLMLAPEQHRALLDRCAGTSPCPIEISGRLAKLVASTERFTSVTLDQIDLGR